MMTWAGGTLWCKWITNWWLRKLCSQWRVGKTDSSDQSFDLHIGLHTRLKDGRLNLFPGILWPIGSQILLLNLTGNVAVHQHVGMTFWHIFLPSSSTMTIGGMLHAKLPRGSPLRNFMYSSAEPTLVCRVVSPRVPYRTVVLDGRKWKWKCAILTCRLDFFTCAHLGPPFFHSVHARIDSTSSTPRLAIITRFMDPLLPRHYPNLLCYPAAAGFSGIGMHSRPWKPSTVKMPEGLLSAFNTSGTTSLSIAHWILDEKRTCLAYCAGMPFCISRFFRHLWICDQLGERRASALTWVARGDEFTSPPHSRSYGCRNLLSLSLVGVRLWS